MISQTIQRSNNEKDRRHVGTTSSGPKKAPDEARAKVGDELARGKTSLGTVIGTEWDVPYARKVYQRICKVKTNIINQIPGSCALNVDRGLLTA